MLSEIFKNQQELMDQFGHIEENSGLLLAPLKKVDLHDRFHQSLIRDFAWRVTEELTEATSQVEIDGKISKEVKEEFMDCLHFMVELMILSGVEVSDISSDLNLHKGDQLEEVFKLVLDVSDLKDSMFDGSYLSSLSGERTSNLLRTLGAECYKVIHHLGKAVNELKNKAWKKEHRITNVEAYVSNLMDSFKYLIRVLMLVGMSPQEVFSAYLDKSTINQKRIEDGV